MISLPPALVVIEITGTRLSEPVVTMLIEQAALISKKCIENLPPELQEAIVMWLAAHLVATTGDSSGTVTTRKLGDAQKSWARATVGEGLKGTSYGQQALLLDPCGCLSRLGKPTATVEVF